MEPTHPFSRKIRFGVFASIFLAVAGVAGSLPVLVLVVIPMYPVLFAVGLVGAFCGISAIFTEKGFHRLIAVLVASVRDSLRGLSRLGYQSTMTTRQRTLRSLNS